MSRYTHPSVDILEAILHAAKSVRVHIYMMLAEGGGRYLQFGAELGRNVNLHTAKNGAVEKLGTAGSEGTGLSGKAGPLAAFTARLAGVLGIHAMPAVLPPRVPESA